MDSFTSKIPIYDTLAMIIPGCVVFTIPMLQYDIYIGKSTAWELLKSYWFVFTILAYVFGLFINIVSELVFVNFRNRPIDIDKARQKIDPALRNVEYFDAWYYVAQVAKKSAVPILEAQVAFMRNMTVSLMIIAIYSLGAAAFCGHCCCVFCFTLLLCIVFAAIILFAMKNRQFKIYERVFEDYKYLKRMKKHRKPNKSVVGNSTTSTHISTSNPNP